MLPSELSNSGTVWQKLESTPNNLSSASNVAPLQTLKTQLIAQLHFLPFRVIEIKKGSEYQIALTENAKFSLIVSFPHLFPHKKLQVKVSTALVHPWITDGVFVNNCPLLNNSSYYFKLDKVLKEVANELIPVYAKLKMSNQSRALIGACTQPMSYPLSQNPHCLHLTSTTSQPYFSNINFIPTNMPRMSVALNSSKVPIISNPPLSQSQNFTSFCTLPISSVSFDQTNSSNLTMKDSSNCSKKITIMSVQDLDKLSNEDIALALSDPGKLEELVISCHGGQIDMFCNRKKEFARQLELLAHSNLAKSKNLEEKKAQLVEKCAEFQAAAARLESLNEQLKEKSKSILDFDSMFDNMRVIAMEAEEKSEAVVNSFMEGKMNVEDFLKSFQEHRKLYHIRSVKCHRLNEHLCYGFPL